MMELTELQAIATAFRRSFEVVDLSNAPGFLPGFPDGCCHWASYMIGHFLKYEQQMEPFEVIGERSPSDGLENHSWLSLDDKIIDITSDEFPDSKEAVIVGTMSEWHKGWKVVKINPIRQIDHYDALSSFSSMLPSEVYKLIVAEARLIGDFKKT